MKINLLYKSLYGMTGIRTVFNQIKSKLKEREIDFCVNAPLDECDVNHIHTVGPRSLIWVKKSEKPVICSAHTSLSTCKGALALYKYWSPLVRKYFKKIYNGSDLMITFSKNGKRELEEMGVKTDTKIVPHGVDLNKFRNGENSNGTFREKLNAGEDDMIVLNVGIPMNRKGLKTFVKVGEDVKENKFVWAGENKMSIFVSSYLERKKIMRECPKNVMFTGWVENIVDAYKSSDIFFFPTKNETFGLTVLEAAASGLPLVLRDIPIFKELFGGHYLGGNTKEEFEKSIRELESKSKRKEYQRKSKRLAEKYSLENRIDELVETYREMAG